MPTDLLRLEIPLWTFFEFIGYGSVGRQTDVCGVVGVVGSEKPAGIPVDDFIIGQKEFREELIAVDVVNLSPGITSPDLVFVVLVKSIAPAFGAVFGKAVGVELGAFAEDDKLAAVGGLSRFAQISPEAGFVHEISATVEKISARLRGDLCGTRFGGRASHGSGPCRATTMAKSEDKSNKQRGG